MPRSVFAQSILIQLKYDLVGQIVDGTRLTRKTVIRILQTIKSEKFKLFSKNPEAFLIKIVRLINEQKATLLIQQITYKLVDDTFGLPTVRDILAELEKPGRDPRSGFEAFSFADVHSLEDLKEGMSLPGIVTNVTDFGAFVDVGVHTDGLVHISCLSKDWIRHPSEVVRVGMKVNVTVTGLDEKRRRISLSMV